MARLLEAAGRARRPAPAPERENLGSRGRRTVVASILENKMIHVLAVITAKPGQRERMLEAYRDNVATVRAEAGCLAYEAVVDVANPAPGFAAFGADSFVVVEKWASLEALQAHAVAPHMKAYAARVKDLTASRAIHVLEPA
jgi:quinol monooxygenase YgiN